MEIINKTHNVVSLDGFIHFTSDEEIHESDFYIHMQNGDGLRMRKCIGGNLPMDARKIIVTTDPKLGITDHRVSPVPNFCDFPQIPQSFIESYVKNPVDKVELEYEVSEDKGYGASRPVPTLKLVNNEVVVVNYVHQRIGRGVSGKLYTKEEVEDLCKNAMDWADDLRCNIDRKVIFGGDPDKEVEELMDKDKWLKENL